MSSIKYWKKIEEQYTYAEATGTTILIRGKAFRGLDPLGLATLEGWPAGSAARLWSSLCSEHSEPRELLARRSEPREELAGHSGPLEEPTESRGRDVA